MGGGGRGWLILVLFTVVVVEQAAMLVPAAKQTVAPVRETPEVRGRHIAEGLGCFSCHGAGGAHGIANPDGKDEVVPALAGGEMMMWAADEAELRRWILDGSLHDDEPKREGVDAGQASGRAIVMPAYRDYVTDAQLEDLVSYLKSISGLQFPEDEKAAAGLERMHALGCFACHGAMGTGGVSNPRSLKGYVPGFVGEDYAELVRDGAELRQWLEKGVSDRFAANPAARLVLGRQALKMPAYGEHLDEPEIEEIGAAVEWLAAAKWRTQPVP